MNARPIKRFLVCVGIVATLTLPDYTTGQPARFSAEELTDRSDVVAVGTVTGLNAEWSSDRKRIFTRVTLSVEQYLKGGEQRNSMTVIIPGGEVGASGELYSHMAKFASNEHVVVFARRGEDGELKVTAGERGKLNIRLDERSGRKLVGENELLEVFASRVTAAVRSPLHRERR